MSSPVPSSSEKARVFYDETAAPASDLAFMNYGYAPLDSEAGHHDVDERYCLQLYQRVLQGAALVGREVLEISCGHGGGAAYVAAEHRPATMIGLDISEQNIGIATRNFGHLAGLSFRIGRAEALPFDDERFDAVLSVEASHLYEFPDRFLSEVHRVLRPGGELFYADLFWSNSRPEPLLEAAGLSVVAHEDITRNVLHALDLDSERREQFVATRIPPALQADYRNWAGVKGHRAYNRFASGEWVYRAFRLQRSGFP